MPSLDILALLAVFAFIALSSRQLGRSGSRAGLPLISGYLLAGMVAGPYILGLLPQGIGEQLRIVDEVSLGFIAFAAGSELYLSELRGQGRSISLVNLGQIVATFSLGAGTLYLLADRVPFIGELGQQGRLAMSVLAGAILVATSPASTIAIINELRAKGPFTTRALSVTVIKDVSVIVLFAISAAAAGAVMTAGSLDPSFVPTLLLDLVFAGMISIGLWKLLEFVLNRSISRILKIGLILGLGYGVFEFSGVVRTLSHESLPFEIHIEPLLVCLIAGFLVANFGPHRRQFE